MPTPLVIVGSDLELEIANDAGLRAISARNQDIASLALRLASEQRAAVIVLDEESAHVIADACDSAGAPSHIVSRERIAEVVRLDSIDREAFAAMLKEELSVVEAKAEAMRAEALDKMLKRMGIHDATQTAIELHAGSADKEKIPTGISSVDEALDGGLSCGELSTLGALSSSGKTTIAGQIADHTAQIGRHVLFVTCEMSRYEMMSASIARLVRNMKRKSGGYIRVPKSAMQSKTKRAALGYEETEAVDQAFAQYIDQIAPRIHIMEPEIQPTASDIRRAAEAIRNAYGQSPLVIIDYLQILRAENERRDERLAVNDNMSTLRKLARDLETHVMVISALSRKSIPEGVTMQAFRESSGIEYASDLMIGLQPQGMTRDLQQTKASEQARKANEIIDAFRDAEQKRCELRILKNRSGSVPRDGIPLTFDAVGCCFYPDRLGEIKPSGSVRRQRTSAR